MRIVVGVVLVSALVLVGCGSDAAGPGGGGSVEAFCTLMEESESSGEELDPTTAEGKEKLQEVLDAAPSEIKGDVEVLFGMIDDFEGVDEDDPEAFEQAFSLMFNPEFISAAENLDTFAVEECGLPPSGDFGDGGTLDDEGFGDDPFGDGGFDDSDDGLDSSAIREYIETNGPTDLGEALTSVGAFGSSSVSLGGPFDIDQAIEACELAGEYAAGQGIDASVEVSDDAGTVVATGPDDTGSCKAA